MGSLHTTSPRYQGMTKLPACWCVALLSPAPASVLMARLRCFVLAAWLQSERRNASRSVPYNSQIVQVSRWATTMGVKELASVARMVRVNHSDRLRESL